MADAVAWADALIAADPHPDEAVIEIATSASRPLHEVCALLGIVGGVCDPIAVIRRTMGDLRRALAEDSSKGPHIARFIYELALNDELPEGEFGPEPYSLDDSFHLAMSGISGTYESAVRRLDEYLREHGLPS